MAIDWRLVRTIGWTIIGIATLVGAGWLFAHYTGGFSRASELAGRIAPSRWVAVIAVTLLFYSLDWLRYFALFRLLGQPFPFGLGLELVAVSYFVSSLTPSAELHLPVMVIVLVHRGYPIVEATAATITKSIYMVMWVIALGLVGVRVADDSRVPPVIGDHLALWLVTPSIIVAALVIIVMVPGAIHRWCARRIAQPALPGWQRRILEALDKLPTTLALIGRSFRPMHLVAHLACVACIACYIVIGHLLAGGVGVRVDGRSSYAAYSVGLMVSYVAPVPGSIGVTEAATAHLLDPAMGAPAMTAAILARICTWYAAATVGAMLFVFELRRIGRARFARLMRKEPTHAS